MNTPIHVDKGEVCELSRCVLKSLPYLSCQGIKHIWKLLTDGVEVLITDTTELAGRASDEIRSAMLLAKKAHLTEEFPWIEIAHYHFLLWVFDIVDDDRDRTIENEVEVFAGVALTKYDRPRFH